MTAIDYRSNIYAVTMTLCYTNVVLSQCHCIVCLSFQQLTVAFQ